MGKVKFVFCAHNHQPIGNFGWVFEKAYQTAYKPFMNVMMSHPKIKWSMHASGMLWEYFSKEHPQYINCVKKLVASGNLEILSGGYYEPIISSIPDRDKIGQITKMTSYLKNKFGCEEADGAWLAERVWEPGLAKILSESGIKYTVLDDAHFAAAGMEPERLAGYYTTEEQGCVLDIFPISLQMRYLVPFRNVEDTIEYFKKLAAENPDSNPVVVMADDGEKFGMWPGTNKHVYENGWLERFLTALEENGDVVETESFSTVRKTLLSSGRIYLPCSSYFEMSEWTLPAGQQRKFDDVLNRYGSDSHARTFMRGGFWKNFLSKYDESNNMHKKMLYVSSKTRKYVEKKKPLSDKISDSLYAGQCNCAYWHGVFGGLYLPHLRNAVYNALLKAESFYNKSFLTRAGWSAFDFDCDSGEEYLYESKTHNIYVSPLRGGTIFEFDLFKINRNFLDVLTRRYEAYHQTLKDNINNAVVASDNEQEAHTIHGSGVKVKEPGLDKYLCFDRRRKSSLEDHFVRKDIRHEDFAFVRYEELGDFASGEYKAALKGMKICLERDGKLLGRDAKITKIISPSAHGYCAEYEIKNNSSESIDVCFAPEQVFAFSSKTGDDNADLKSVDVWKRYDDYLKIELEIKLSEPCDFFVYPIETVSNSDNGYERTYQGTAAVPLVKCFLESGRTMKFRMDTIVRYK
jgi:alpha-amylase